jgi:class 3 adenylate cyclase
VKLGMPLVHRIRLLKAISNLEASEKSAVAVAPAPEPLPHSPGPPIPEAVGERRHLTVMFCDLVDSTGIAAKLDAEEWRDLVGAYLDAASAAVTEMGGKVAKRLGDGLMALFGYPVTQENDAEAHPPNARRPAEARQSDGKAYLLSPPASAADAKRELENTCREALGELGDEAILSDLGF